MKENPNFLAIEARARKSVLDENTNLAYHSHDQLTSKYRDLKEKYQGGKLSLLNAGRRLLRLTSTMDQYERIQVAIASIVETGSYVRVHAIIANCHKHKRGLHRMYSDISTAISGVFKNTSYSEKEMDIALLASWFLRVATTIVGLYMGSDNS